MKLGFLGYGHLARAIDAGIRTRSLLAPEDICVCAKSAETKEYAKSLSHMLCSDVCELFALCDVVVLAVKPKVFREMSNVLKAIDTSGKKVISVMAAVSISELSSVFTCPVMRVMPTVAVTNAEDIIGYTAHGDFDGIIGKMNLLGNVIRLDESMLDRLTVASSCGLGFAAHMLEMYKAECVQLGFSGEESRLIVSRIFGYAAQCGDFAALEELVATKGGLTEAGIREMDCAQKDALNKAFTLAKERAGIKN